MAFLVVMIAITPSDANFNLYLTQKEVRRILGLTAELFYVREGVVNDYALNWIVPVPADVHALYFTWQATSKKQREASPRAADFPAGPPLHRQGCECRGRRHPQHQRDLARPRQPRRFCISTRRKVCLRGLSAEMFFPHLGPMGNRDDDSLPVIFCLLSIMGAITIVVTIIIIVAVIRKNKLKRDSDQQILGGNEGDIKTGTIATSSLLRAVTPNNHTYTLPSSFTINSYASVRKMARTISPMGPMTFTTQAHVLHRDSTALSLKACSMDSDSKDLYDSVRETASRDGAQSVNNTLNKSEVIVDPSAADLQERFRQMEIDRHRVRLTAVVQEGSFGRVFRGWIQRDHPEQDQQVLIKTVTEAAPHEEIVLLYREGTHLFNLYHRNILTMVGISFANSSSPFILYPFHGYRNLKRYLHDHRGGHLRAAELVDLAIQAAHGLSFLHSANILHGDIGARNCVVSEKLQMRITDAGLSRDLFPSDYDSLGTEVARPIKWMAYEAICDGIISTASDVWSYGVLVWELTTLAQQPYVEVAGCEMEEYLRDGYRLAQPLNCPDDLYKVMAFCWAIHPKDRPHVKLLLDYLAAFHKQLNSFI
ncbi:tyrosine-protein kinase Drl-like [Macrobrachium nipponense]|uniref:tyrosine-protein kinase Drl-like n=1 Tax=Macrobrachium nipponense TaxID=159736 RepID=UPI0030C7B54A